MRTISPGGFDFWFGPWVLPDKYKLVQYPLKDGDEIQIRNPTIFLMIPLIVHINSAQLPEPLIVPRVMTIKDVKIMLQWPWLEIFGDWPVRLEIFEGKPSDGLVPLGDMIKVGELEDTHVQSLWERCWTRGKPRRCALCAGRKGLASILTRWTLIYSHNFPRILDF